MIDPATAAPHPAPFTLYGGEAPASPIILSVPHAGRHYPSEIVEQARVPIATLQRLEDRSADLLASELIASGGTVIVANIARAAIDLNRNEREVDPAMVRGVPHGQPLQSSAKLRGGLGLIPRRLQGVGDLWAGPIPWKEVERRLALFHRPYHAEIARLMRRARQVFGHAILVDLHSMPPLAPAIGRAVPPHVVLGDRFGRSAGGRLMALAADVAQGQGVATAINHPYAGDHLVERHGRPAIGMHALQIEVDRTLYLDAALDGPGPGLARTRRMVTDMVRALEQELPRSDYALAAE